MPQPVYQGSILGPVPGNSIDSCVDYGNGTSRMLRISHADIVHSQGFRIHGSQGEKHILFFVGSDLQHGGIIRQMNRTVYFRSGTQNEASRLLVVLNTADTQKSIEAKPYGISPYSAQIVSSRNLQPRSYALSRMGIRHAYAISGIPSLLNDRKPQGL